MKISTVRTAKSNSELIALIVDGSYMILADGHHSNQLHSIYSDFTVSVGGRDSLEGTLAKYGEDRLQPVYMGDTLIIETGT